MTTAVVTGCAGPAGQATVRRLLAAGWHVHGADAAADRVAEFVTSLSTDQRSHFDATIVDLMDESATRAWATTVTDAGGVDLVAHLVGGWRGGTAFEDNTIADSDFLFGLLVRTLQTVTLSFHDALLAAPNGRFVIVSAQAAAKPVPGGAGYAAAKAAAEAWTAAMAASFAKVQAEHLTAAAVVLVIKALLTDAMRAAKPDAAFTGYTHADEVAAAIAALAAEPAHDLNGVRREIAQ